MNVICYGDSNTYGYDPRGYFGGRYDYPWPEILAEKTGWTVVNQGENGRRIPKIPVKFSEEADLILIMLGTNDLLEGHTPEEASKAMQLFLEKADLSKKNVVIVSPPKMVRGEWVENDQILLYSEKLGEAYQRFAEDNKIRICNTAGWEIPLAYDGVHFTQEGHRIFADRVCCYLMEERQI